LHECLQSELGKQSQERRQILWEEYGYVKGKTKIACYLNLRREVNRKEIEESTGSNMEAGTGTKKELYRQMNN
jgi:hypothetical protein